MTMNARVNPLDLAADLLGLVDVNRPIRLRIAGAAGPNAQLLVKHVSGHETIFGGIEYTLQCVSTRSGMPLKQFIANAVEIQFVTDSGALRSVCGIIDQITEGQGDGGLATYQLNVRDAFSLLEKTCNTRVFRNLSEVDITNVILREWREANPVAAQAFSFQIGHLKSYPAREFTMQYNESNAAFLKRLWKRRGIAWFIQSDQSADGTEDAIPAHTLVLFDDVMSLKENAAGTVRFGRDKGTDQRDSITAWHATRTLTPGQTTRRSWDYAQAWSMGSQDLSAIDQGETGNQFARSLDDYLVDVPHTGDDATDYRSLDAARMQRHEYVSKYFQGEGSDRNMCCGQWMVVSGHPELDLHDSHEREFVVTELHIEAENNLPKKVDDIVRRLFALNHWHEGGGSLARANDERGMRYANRFTCVRRGIPLVPQYDPRIDLPRTEAQSVTVVGPVNEEIHCDEAGRVKVRFPACRVADHEHAQGAGASDSDRDSAWLRVASSWASAQFGAISLPRVGDEVIVIFLGGDPDKPLIVGRVHGAKTPPPAFSHVSKLPGDRFVSGIKSKEISGGRYNQLRMDDTPGQISAQLASEHAGSQLNLGFLTHPRTNGQAAYRGEGFELATNESGAIRTAKSLLLSAWKRLDTSGNQLSNEEHVALMQDCLDLFKSLGQVAGANKAPAIDSAAQGTLKADIESSATPAGKDKKSTVSISAPDGIALTTPKSQVTYAGVNIDTVAMRHMQSASGGRFSVNAGDAISLFAQSGGITQIAHEGKFLIESQHDDLQINSAKDFKVTAGKRVIVMADEELTLMVSGGAYLRLKGGDVEVGGPGSMTIKTDGHHWEGPANASTDLPTFGKSDFGRVPQLVRATDGEPVEGVDMFLIRDGEDPVTGTTSQDGRGPKIKSNRIQQLRAIFYRKPK